LIQPKDQLSLAAAQIARAAPKSWAEFLAVLATLTASAQHECMHAPSDKMQVAQGRAQQLTELGILFGDAISRANELEEKQRKMKRE
jgi:hypothetical protein